MDTWLIFHDFVYIYDGATECCTLCGLLDSRCCCEGGALGKSGHLYSKQRQDMSFRWHEQRGARFQEKFLILVYMEPYPKTDTGGQVEKTKVNE